MPKFEKLTNCDHRLVSTADGQDTSACRISVCSLHAFSGKCPETPHLIRFSKSKWCQKEDKSTECDHNIIISDGGQDTSSCQISGHSLHAFCGKCLETSPDGQTVIQMDMPQNCHGWWDGPIHPCTGGKRVFQASYSWTDGWTDWRMDREPENIIPLAPKGRGIKRWSHLQNIIRIHHRFSSSEIPGKLLFIYPEGTSCCNPRQQLSLGLWPLCGCGICNVHKGQY